MFLYASSVVIMLFICLIGKYMCLYVEGFMEVPFRVLYMFFLAGEMLYLHDISRIFSFLFLFFLTVFLPADLSLPLR